MPGWMPHDGSQTPERSRPQSSVPLTPHPPPVILFIPLSNAFYAAQLPLHQPSVDTVMTFWLSVCKWEMKWVCDAVPGEEWSGEKPFINWSCGGAERVEGWVQHSGDHRQDYKKKRRILKHGTNEWNYTLEFNCPLLKASPCCFNNAGSFMFSNNHLGREELRYNWKYVQQSQGA